VQKIRKNGGKIGSNWWGFGESESVDITTQLAHALACACDESIHALTVVADKTTNNTSADHVMR